MLQNRRQFLHSLFQIGMAASTAAVLSSTKAPAAVQPGAIKKPIPSSGEQLPVIGMGTSRTFDIGDDRGALDNLEKVLKAFFESGGTVIDSSPMYGSAEQVVGRLFGRISYPKDRFVATKVWTNGRQPGIEQMQQSMFKMQVDRFDLMQIHNLVDWRTHIETLNQWKDEGKIRYAGVTTSHGRNHEELVEILKNHQFDFVQFSYNIVERKAEKDLLPVASDRGVAVLVNRPFMRGELFARARNKPLPDWAGEIGCKTWSQFLLKYAVSHPSVTCAIPATAKLHHMMDNMGANFGKLPDSRLRLEMEEYFRKLD